MESKQTFRQKIKAQKAEIQAGADAKLRKIQNEGADAWEDSKSGVEAVYADLCKAVSNTAEKFR
jgi:hypothetical protein